MTVEWLGWSRYVLAFIMTALVDAAWVYAVRSAGHGPPGRATVWSGVLFALSALTTCLYVADPWCVIAAGAGGMAGTYVTVRLRCMTKP